MAKDIVERLRTQPPISPTGDTHDLREEAANEIWNLRQIVRDVRIMANAGAFKAFEGEAWLKRVQNIDLNS